MCTFCEAHFNIKGKNDTQETGLSPTEILTNDEFIHAHRFSKG